MTYTEILFEPDAAGFVQVTINRPQKLNARSNRVMFVLAVRQITFSGANAIATGQEVLYVTEAAVFRLTADGLQLEEVAPGLDPERRRHCQDGLPADDGRFARHDARRVVRPRAVARRLFPAFQ